MNKRSFYLNFLLSLLIFYCGYSQNVTPYVISSLGGEAQLDSVSISYTLGETFIFTLSNNYVLTQGFHQSEYTPSKVEEQSLRGVDVKICELFENESIIVKLENFESENSLLEIFDLMGKRIFSDQIKKNEIVIDISDYSIRALYTNSTGSYNTATGVDANYSNTGGTYNTSTGYRAMYNTTTGSSNSAFGSFALHYNLAGSENVAVGRYAGYGNYNVNFNQCTFVGANSYPTVSRTNVTMLGYGITNNECTGDNQVLLGNTSVAQIRAAVGSITTYSDGRFKTDIRDDVHGLDFILKLKPVSFRKEPLLLHKIWGTPDSLVQKLDFTDMRNRRWIGLIAQDVEKAMLDCGFDFPGLHKPQNEKDVYTIDYVDLIMPIIKSIQELQSQIDSLKMEIEVLKQKNTQLLESNINYESEIKALQQEISEIKKTIGEYFSNKH